MITQGKLHHDKRVIQKPPQINHLVESALGTMLNDVALWVYFHSWEHTLQRLIVTRDRVPNKYGNNVS